MSCYFRHLREVFAEAGVEPSAENKRELDRLVHELMGVEYKHCPEAWRAVKARMAEDRGRLVRELRKRARARLAGGKG